MKLVARDQYLLCHCQVAVRRISWSISSLGAILLSLIRRLNYTRHINVIDVLFCFVSAQRVVILQDSIQFKLQTGWSSMIAGETS